MRFPTSLLLAVLASCAAGTALPGGASASGSPPTGAWPSLARRPAESATSATSRDTLAPAGAGKPAGNQPAGLSDAAARLVIAERDVEQLELRWRTQSLAARQAQAAGRLHPADEAEAAAQLESGRLDKLAGQVTDARLQIESIAGDLAVAAAAGIDVNAPLRAAGVLLIRCAKLTMADPVANVSAAAVKAPM